jgi:deoxycytidine triphosphate deaminase
MSILTDGQIRHLMSTKQLISGGDPERAVSCCYEFRPGLVVTTGGNKAKKCVKDWTHNREATHLHKVGPGEMIWVRTLERVSLPKDMCAFWWQTNRLSRKGLMLVNMSMVEPGYTGHLACLLVNFNKVPVPLNPDTVIAKLVFFQLSEDVIHPSPPSPAPVDYDRSIVEAAMSGPRTFLSVADIALGIRDEKKNAIRALQAEKDQLIATLRDDSRNAANEAKKELSDDIGRTLRRALGPAAIGFALIIAATSFVPWLQSKIQPDLHSEVKSVVSQEISDRLTLTGNVDQISGLETRLKQVEQQLQDAQRRADGTPPTTSGKASTAHQP